MSNTRSLKDIRADTIESGIIKQKSETIVTAAGTNNISLDYGISFLDTSAGAASLALPVGPIGQTKIISLSVYTGNGTLTKADGNLGASVATSIVFDSLSDTVQLISTGSVWEVISNNGATIS